MYLDSVCWHIVYLFIYIYCFVTHHWSVVSNCGGCLAAVARVCVTESDKERGKRETNLIYINSSHNNMRMIFISVNKGASFIRTLTLRPMLRHWPESKYLCRIVLNFHSHHAQPKRGTEIACLSLSYEWSQTRAKSFLCRLWIAPRESEIASHLKCALNLCYFCPNISIIFTITFT